MRHQFASRLPKPVGHMMPAPCRHEKYCCGEEMTAYLHENTWVGDTVTGAYHCPSEGGTEVSQLMLKRHTRPAEKHRITAIQEHLQ